MQSRQSASAPISASAPRCKQQARGFMVFFLAVWPIRWRRKSRRGKRSSSSLQDIPSTSKDIQAVKVESCSAAKAPRRRPSFDTFEYSFRRNSSSFRIFTHGDAMEGSSSIEYSPPVTDTEMVLSQGSESNSGTTTASGAPKKDVSSYLGWGNWYCFEELEIATDGFSAKNIIGEGGYGVVYKGEVSDGTLVACKYLTSKDQAEKEFLVEVETIGRVRHKNLVRLLGFCAEGEHRILVYEYVNNGNLDEWLHGKTSRLKTPSWDARMKIVLGTAKGLAYMHEAIEPKIVHRDIKASNILLDRSWNAKVSDFGLAKFLGCEKTHVMTRVMGTFGYVAPEYANTGLLNERSDVYSFGVLLMEVVTGRDPVDYSRAPGEVNLVDWLKIMLATKRMEEIADPRLEEKPSPRALKKALITAFQCVHPDVRKRPSMGHVVHLLEAENFQLPESWRAVKEMGLSKIIESQTQKRLVQSLSKELQGSEQTPRNSKRMLAHQRYAA